MHRIPEKFHAKIIFDAVIESDTAHLPVCISENMYKLILDAVDETTSLFDGRIIHIQATMSLNKGEILESVNIK